jgi:starvation-inducible DNA-binding protein
MNVQQVLNRQVANLTVLYTKLHHYHWYVTGDQFFTLHEKFEQLYDEAAEYLDAAAERLLMLQGRPVSTLAECLKETSLREASGNENPSQMVREAANDLRTMVGELKQGMEMAAQAGDEGTHDLLLEMANSWEKHIWMLESFLK